MGDLLSAARGGEVSRLGCWTLRASLVASCRPSAPLTRRLTCRSSIGQNQRPAGLRAAPNTTRRRPPPHRRRPPARSSLQDPNIQRMTQAISQDPVFMEMAKEMQV